MTLFRTSLPLVALCLTGMATGLTACAPDYDKVDDACRPNGKVAGGKELSDREYDVVNRMNCHRRQANLGHAQIGKFVQAAMEGHRDYVLIEDNANLDVFVGSRSRARFFQQEDQNDEGFTGFSAIPRLREAGQLIYSGVRVWEAMRWTVENSARPAGTADETVDDLMRDWTFREQILRRSWVEGGYSEFVLDSDWLQAANACSRPQTFGCAEANGTVPADVQMRVHYLMVIALEPPVEQIQSPTTYPTPGQTNVPLYTNTLDLRTVAELGTATPAQTGYPITVYGNYLLSSDVRTIEPNWYGTTVLARLSRVGDAYPLSVPVAVRYPGSDAFGVFPDGLFARESVAVYPVFPLEPSTEYRLETDVWNRAGLYNVDFNFTTAAEDPGLGQPALPQGKGYPGGSTGTSTGTGTGTGTGDTGGGGTGGTTKGTSRPAPTTFGPSGDLGAWLDAHGEGAPGGAAVQAP